jgi:hypothetical protein
MAKKTDKSKIVRAKRQISPLTIAMPITSPKISYDKDFYGWSLEQSKLLKKKEYAKLDAVNLIEEIEALGRNEKRALESQIKRLLMHLLKIKYQPTLHSPSWDTSVTLSRIEIQEVLADNPSLKPKTEDVFVKAYRSARLSAALETGLDEKTFPIKCPWTFAECMQGTKAATASKKTTHTKKKKGL